MFKIGIFRENSKGQGASIILYIIVTSHPLDHLKLLKPMQYICSRPGQWIKPGQLEYDFKFISSSTLSEDWNMKSERRLSP